MIIDGHAHACGEYLTQESIQPKLNAAGCDMVVLAPGENGSKKNYCLPERARKHPWSDVVSSNNLLTRIVIAIMRKNKDIPAGNELVFELHRQLPDRVLQCYWITRDNIGQLHCDYARMHFVMVKMHQCWEWFTFDDELFLEAAAWAESHGLPMFLHVYNAKQMRSLIGYLREHPSLKVIIGHLYQAELFYTEPKELTDHVWFDLSNCYFVSQKRILKAIEHLGAEHLLLGSDTPYGKKALEKTIERIRELPISDEAKERILGRNLRALLPQQLL